MFSSAPIRFVAAASFAFSALLPAQSRPAARATPVSASPVSALPATLSPPELPRTPAQLPAHPADVTYANGMLTISASNSSLNQILRDVSRQTAMKISGGVVDERVFGQYGPSPAAQILNTLLDGTSSNVLLVQRGGPAPSELILTPRQGGPSPPNPDAAALEEEEQSKQLENKAPRQAFQPGQPQPNGSSTPAQSSPANAPSSEITPGAPASADPTQPQSPTGVKTPQQIYDQLQRMRQQQLQQQQTNPH